MYGGGLGQPGTGYNSGMPAGPPGGYGGFGAYSLQYPFNSSPISGAANAPFYGSSLPPPPTNWWSSNQNPAAPLRRPLQMPPGTPGGTPIVPGAQQQPGMNNNMAMAGYGMMFPGAGGQGGGQGGAMGNMPFGLSPQLMQMLLKQHPASPAGAPGFTTGGGGNSVMLPQNPQPLQSSDWSGGGGSIPYMAGTSLWGGV